MKNLADENAELRERIAQLENLLHGEDWHCYVKLGLTAKLAKLLAAFANRDFLTRDQIGVVIDAGDEIIDFRNYISTNVYRLRKVLKPHKIEIRVGWSEGYFMDEANKRRLKGII